MPKLINADDALVKIAGVIDGCTARHFMIGADSKVAERMLIECANILHDAPDAAPLDVLRCEHCHHWGRIPDKRENDRVKLCAVAGYMIGKNGYCVFGKERMRGQEKTTAARP